MLRYDTLSFKTGEIIEINTSDSELSLVDKLSIQDRFPSLEKFTIGTRGEGIIDCQYLPLSIKSLYMKYINQL